MITQNSLLMLGEEGFKQHMITYQSIESDDKALHD